MYHLWSIIMRKHYQDSVPLPGWPQTDWQCRQCQEGLSGRKRRSWRWWRRQLIRAGGRRSSSASSSLMDRTPITHRNGSIASAISSCCYQESEQLIVQPDELCHVMIVNFSDDRESFTLFVSTWLGRYCTETGGISGWSATTACFHQNGNVTNAMIIPPLTLVDKNGAQSGSTLAHHLVSATRVPTYPLVTHNWPTFNPLLIH